MWKQDKLDAQLATVAAVADKVVVSGGLAWHLMSPPHAEAKHLHDHKDVDLFVVPERFAETIAVLKGLGFNRYWTKYDGRTPGFYRYGKSEIRPEDRDKPPDRQRHVKVLLDLFVAAVPSIEVGGLRVVEPKHLLGLYRSVHLSGACSAVKAAAVLIARGLDPVGRAELLGPAPRKVHGPVTQTVA